MHSNAVAVSYFLVSMGGEPRQTWGDAGQNEGTCPLAFPAHTYLRFHFCIYNAKCK